MTAYTIEENKDLHTFNTFGIHAQARYFVRVASSDQLQSILKEEKWAAIPKFILGGGSNILFTQNFSGLLLKNEIKGIEVISETPDEVILKIGAGEEWHALVMHCIEQGWGGIENLSLIPGTVGAAPIQNIGAYGVELKDVFESLEALSIKNGTTKKFTQEECEFGYRESVFKSKSKDQFFITSVTLRLQKKPQFNVQYGAIKEILEKNGISTLSLRAISDAVIHIRQSKLPDPKVIGNAGSFFKNPIIAIEQFEKIQTEFPEAPHFTESSDTIKIPAGWLIEKCGWKGKRMNEVGVHDKQALVLVNYGNGTGAAIQLLATEIQQSVLDKFGIRLMAEVNVI